MQIISRRLGNLEIPEEQVLYFPDGLIGFVENKRYVVVDLKRGAGILKWLQCIDEPDLGFVILDVYAVFPEYNPEFYQEDLRLLQCENPNDLITMAVVTVPRTVTRMTANLQAPLLINPLKRIGRQVITSSPAYSIKHAIFPALQNLVQRTG